MVMPFFFKIKKFLRFIIQIRCLGAKVKSRSRRSGNHILSLFYHITFRVAGQGDLYAKMTETLEIKQDLLYNKAINTPIRTKTRFLPFTIGNAKFPKTKFQRKFIRKTAVRHRLPMKGLYYG